MSVVIARTIGAATGAFVLGVPLGRAFVDSRGCPDAGLLGPILGAWIGVTILGRIVRSGPIVTLPTLSRGQFGISHLMLVVFLVAILLGIARFAGAAAATFIGLCVGSTWLGSRFGHGLPGAMIAGTAFALIRAANTKSDWTSSLVVLCILLGLITEKILEFWDRVNKAPRPNSKDG